MTKNLLMAAVASLGLAGAGAASAGQVKLSGYTFNGVYDGAGTDPAGAGLFNFEVLDSGDSGLSGTLESFCIDLDNFASTTDAVYTLKTADEYFGPGSDVLGDLDRLYGNFAGDFTDSSTAAAFQLALWEIIQEDGSGNYTLDSTSLTPGNFSVVGYGDVTDENSIAGTAQTWLSDLGTDLFGFQFFVLDIDGKQDQLIVNPTPTVKVPEPGTLALMGLGLFGLGLRRRKS